MEFHKIAQWLSFFLFFTAALIHIGFFVIETFLYQKDSAIEKFGLTPEKHKATKVWAFNQGFYNLFLGLGTLWGLSYVLKKQIMVAGALTSFCGFSMIGAGIVLWVTVPNMRKAALLQLLPPLLGFVFLSFHILHFVNGGN